MGYLIRVTAHDEGSRKQAGKPGMLERIFGATSKGALETCRYRTSAGAKGAIDHDTVPEVLAKLREMKSAAARNLIEYVAANPRQKGFRYDSGIDAEIWLAPWALLKQDIALTGKIRPDETFVLKGEDITAENLKNILTRCDTAQSRAMLLAEALAPAKAVRAMKPLRMKKPV